MNESRLARLAPLTGVIALVLFSIGAALLGIYDYLPAADRLQEILSDNATNVFAGGYIGSISAFFMIWFAGSVFSVLREREGGTGWLSMIAFGGVSFWCRPGGRILRYLGLRGASWGRRRDHSSRGSYHIRSL
jgi:hypothetical protein